MRFLVLVFSLVLFNSAYAADKKAPVSEPSAQDLSARLDKVEKILDNRALLDMLELLETLKTEVNSLRGEIEVQTHTLDQLKQKQRDLYTDIDRRLQRLESNKTTTANELEVLDTGANSETTATTTTNDEPTLVVETASDIAKKADAAAEAPVEKTVDPLKAEAEYQRAFKLLKESRYDQAEKSFKTFLTDYPDSDFSDNAQYWLGETNYVLQKYDVAINEYQNLLNNFPDSKKVSHALLKIGYSYDALGNAADAKKTLTEVMKQYPGTTAARLADERLRKISAAKESNT